MCQHKVTIIIPCYNAERYVGEAIQSALDQTYPRTEVIVIDDGSTDGSLDVIVPFGDRLRWQTGPNRGACAARNRGIEMARGELIQFLDADDLLHPRKLEIQLKEQNRTKADIVMVFGHTSDPNDSMNNIPRRRYDGGDPVLFMLRGVLQTPAPLHRRENLLAVGGFREDLPCAQERDLHLRLACEGLMFHQVPEVLYTVRRQPASLSSDSLKVLDQHADIAWRGYYRLQERGELTDRRSRAFAAWLASDARIYLRAGLKTKAEKYFQLAQQMHPDGGLEAAYRRPTRVLRRLVGPALTERVVRAKRWLAQR